MIRIVVAILQRFCASMYTLSKIGQDVTAGKNPEAVIYDPGSKRVFAFNGRSPDATVIDAEKGTVAGTVALEGKPEFAAADGAGHVYVNIEDTSKVFDIDSHKAGDRGIRASSSAGARRATAAQDGGGDVWTLRVREIAEPDTACFGEIALNGAAA